MGYTKANKAISFVRGAMLAVRFLSMFATRRSVSLYSLGVIGNLSLLVFDWRHWRRQASLDSDRLSTCHTMGSTGCSLFVWRRGQDLCDLCMTSLHPGGLLFYF